MGDLSDLIGSDKTKAQAVPIMEGTADMVSSNNVAAATLRPDVAKVKGRTCRLAFAIADFKLQGRALPKLIRSV